MRPIIIIVFLLTYAFVKLPLEITDNFLAYLIPFIISIVGLCIGILNFHFIKSMNGRYKKIVRIANILTIIVFSFLTIYNFPKPESRGLRCKNWTDISMLINPKDNSQQYVFQSLEISGSIYSHRHGKVRPINSWLRWNHFIKTGPQTGDWLYIDNSKNGKNAVPFPLDNSRINFEMDKTKAVLVTMEDGQIKNQNL